MFFTANPVADAERREDSLQQQEDAWLAAEPKIAQLALATVSAEIEALTPSTWDADVLTGAYINPAFKDSGSEVLSTGLYGLHPDAALRASFYELLSCKCSEAVAFRAELSRHQAGRVAEWDTGFTQRAIGQMEAAND